MEEDIFHKTSMQKKPKLDRIHKSTPVVVQTELFDSANKRLTDQFHRGVWTFFNCQIECGIYV